MINEKPRRFIKIASVFDLLFDLDRFVTSPLRFCIYLTLIARILHLKGDLSQTCPGSVSLNEVKVQMFDWRSKMFTVKRSSSSATSDFVVVLNVTRLISHPTSH